MRDIMHDTAARLHDRISRLAPVAGVSIGRLDDRSTWRIDFADGATEDQKAAAQGAIVAFDMLSAIKARLLARIDEDAEKIRLRYITPGHGMAQVYKEKQEQAAAVLAMSPEDANALPHHGASQFPILAASVGIEADTLHDVAVMVWERFEQFQALGFVIERTRLLGKKAVGEASDEASATAAYEAIRWTV